MIHIGTSGWHYKHWLGKFYPEGTSTAEMLPYYLRHFDTVELNNSFYHLPKESSFATWKAKTPPKFLFAVKGSRFITHMKKLKDPIPALDEFLPRVEILGRKLGPILFQLPPRWKVNVERLVEFLEALPRKHRYAFEFREPSWFNEEVDAVLKKYNAANCIYELAGFHSPVVLTADWTYIRLHGPTAFKYQGSYTTATLRAWATKIDEWRSSLKAIYVYFDNDQSAYAVKNAQELKRLVGSEPSG